MSDTTRSTTNDHEEQRFAPPAGVTGHSRPLWRRPRFALGLMVVAASVALGSWAVARAGAGHEAWAAATDLTPGESIQSGDLRPVRVQWDGETDRYLTGPPPSDGVVVSFVAAGELVPARAIGTTPEVAGRPMAVPLSTGTHLRAGVLADLWAVQAPEQVGETATTDLLAAAVPVLGVEKDSSLLRSGSGEVARVLVPDDVVARVLAAQGSDAELRLVERPGE